MSSEHSEQLMLKKAFQCQSLHKQFIILHYIVKLKHSTEGSKGKTHFCLSFKHN